MTGLIEVILGSVDADTFLIAVVMIASFVMLNYRISQQEALVKSELSNGVRKDIKTLDQKVDTFARQLAQLQGEHIARHGGGHG